MYKHLPGSIKPIALGLVVCILISSCAPSSRLHVIRSDDYARLEHAMDGRKFEITLRNGSVFEGRKLRIKQDSVFWHSTKSGLVESSTIQKVSRIEVEGTKLVSIILAGSAIAAMFLVRIPPPECHSDSCTSEALGYEYAKVFKFLGLGLLAGLGWFIGTPFQTDHIYEIHPSVQQSNNLDNHSNIDSQSRIIWP